MGGVSREPPAPLSALLCDLGRAALCLVPPKVPSLSSREGDPGFSVCTQTPAWHPSPDFPAQPFQMALRPSSHGPIFWL